MDKKQIQEALENDHRPGASAPSRRFRGMLPDNLRVLIEKRAAKAPIKRRVA